MTNRFDVAHDPDVVARWCSLAEQRLDYLTELFKNGRWRRYYSHAAFLENIQEAKAMVAHWRALSAPGSARQDNTPILIPDVTAGSVSDVVEAASREIHLPAASEVVLVDEAPPAPAPEALEKMSSGAEVMKDRYSLLRNLTL